MKSLIYSATCITLLPLLFACGSETPPAEEKMVWDSAARVHITKDKQTQFNIRVQAPQVQRVSSSFTGNGRITLLARDQEDVTARLSGTIARVLVQEGQRVRKGEALLEISSTEYITLQEDYLNARSELGFLKADFERQRELKNANVTSGKDFQLAESKYRGCLTRLKATEARLRYLGIDAGSLRLTEESTLPSVLAIRSATDGYVLRLPVSNGMNVKPETELAHLVNVDHCYVNAFVYEKDIDRVYEGQQVQLLFTNPNIPQLPGKVTFVNPGLDPATRTVTVHIALTGTNRNVLPDMTVTTRFLSEPMERMMLPANAFLSENGHYFVYYCLPSAPEDFIKTEVQWLASENELVAFAPLKPLPEGVLFAVKGSLLIDTEAHKGDLTEE